MTTRRLLLTIAYDGTPWRGWQGQSHGMGIQNKLISAMSAVAKQPVHVHGAGRTDSGVHALAHTAHADVPTASRITHAGWVKALNSMLPPSIRVMTCEDAPEGFHARFHAKGKIYRYRILRSAVMPPLEHNRAWHIYGPMDLGALRQCLSSIVGTHNFARLSANRGFPGERERRANDPSTTTRNIYRAELMEHGDELIIEVEGGGFLYRMVRLILGGAMQVARGRESLEWFQSLLSDPGGEKNNQCAPACGLYLARVLYEPRTGLVPGAELGEQAQDLDVEPDQGDE